jgi:hypothetical protein
VVAVVDVEVGASAAVGDDMEDELDVDGEGATEEALGPGGVEGSLAMLAASAPPWRTVHARVG